MGSRLDEIAWPVHTERLTIRPAELADLEATWRYRRLEDVTRWMTGAPGDIEAYRVKFENPERLAKTLLIEADGVIVGDLMLNIGDAWGQTEVAEQAKGVQAELGWCLAPDSSGRGYATEAVRALIRLCFEDLGLRRVTANCFADNVASWRLMERLGMRREIHTVRESLHRSGEWMDGMGYALLADEWRTPGSADDDVEVRLSSDEALVLSDWLSRNEAALPYGHPGEQVALWNLDCLLEKRVSRILHPDYNRLVAEARDRLAGETEAPEPNDDRP